MTSRIMLTTAATFSVAAFIFSGCVTPRQANEIKDEVKVVQAQNKEILDRVARMDSTLALESLESKKLRNDLNMTVEDLQRQISSLLANYNDLLQKIDDLRRVPRSTKPDTLKSSPGASDASAGMSGQAASDCANSYDESFILVRRGEYEKAITGFRTFLTSCEKHNLAKNAHYWIGESFYALEKYDEAIAEFDIVLNQYKSSELTSKSLYKLGRSQQELGKKADAKKTFQRIVDEFPNTLEAEQSRERMKDLR